MKKQLPGYTLIELAVAMALAGVVTMAALSSFATFSRHRVRLERATAADDVAKTVVQYLIRESQRIGGAALRPWQAIAVEQDPCSATGGVPCIGGDRVTFAFPDETAVFPGCSIERLTATAVTFSSVTHDSVTGCCNLFQYDDDGNTTIAAADSMRNEHMMFSSTGFGGTAKEVYKAVSYSNDLGDTSTCTFNYVESGQTRPLSSLKDDGTRPTATDFASTGFIVEQRGNVLPIKVATAYIGCDGNCVGRPENRALFLFSDRNAGVGTALTVDTGDDNFVVSPNIADLQVSLGYDNDEDGEVVESEDGLNDDFAGNNFNGSADNGRSAAPATSTVVVTIGNLSDGSPVTAGVESATSPPNSRLLRMIRIGVISAVKVNDRAFRSRAQLPGGQVVEGEGLHVRALSSKAAFRSLNLLE